MAVFINLKSWNTAVFLNALLNLVLAGTVEQEQYVYRGSTKTCLPVFNCEENHYVKVCAVSGTRETCEPCENGEVQPNLVSSIDDDITRKCFRPNDPYECPDSDTVHSRTHYNAIYCKKPCRCNINKCYWGEPCVCQRKATPCSVGEELDVITGDCRPCPKGKHKTTVGCGPCRFITSQGEGKVTTHRHPDNSTENTKDEMPEIPLTLEVIVLIPTGVAVVAVFIMFVAVLMYLRYRKLKSSHSKVSSDPENAGAEVQEKAVTVNGRPETPGNEETPLLPEKEPDDGEGNKGPDCDYSIQESQSHTSSDIPDSHNDTADVSKLPVQVNDVDNTCTVSPEYRAIHGRDQFSVTDSSVSTDVNMNCIASRSHSIPTENEEDTDPKSNCLETDLSEKCIVNGPSIPIESD